MRRYPIMILAATIGVSGADEASATCRNMSSPSEIPAGWHPTTVQWSGGDGPDLVCIARSNTPQAQVSHWKGFGTPAGYRILRTDHSLNPTFKGCAQYSSWQGVNTCMTSWPTSQVQRSR